MVLLPQTAGLHLRNVNWVSRNWVTVYELGLGMPQWGLVRRHGTLQCVSHSIGRGERPNRWSWVGIDDSSRARITGLVGQSITS